jgi:hypothetical protein
VQLVISRPHHVTENIFLGGVDAAFLLTYRAFVAREFPMGLHMEFWKKS